MVRLYVELTGNMLNLKTRDRAHVNIAGNLDLINISAAKCWIVRKYIRQEVDSAE